VRTLTVERDEALEENRACALLVERLASTNDEKDRTLEKLQSAMRGLWSIQQAAQQKADEVSGLSKEGSDLLVSCQDLLEAAALPKESE
jgi:redox-regulated HSP33 family molecular chaperone